MNRIPPDGKSKAPRPRPFWKPPRKPTGRIIKSQVERKEEGANSDDRSTTGSPSLNEKSGTLVPSDQRDVSAPPTKLHLTAEEDSSRKRAKELFKPKIPRATKLNQMIFVITNMIMIG